MMLLADEMSQGSRPRGAVRPPQLAARFIEPLHLRLLILAQLGHGSAVERCPLLGEKQTSLFRLVCE